VFDIEGLAGTTTGPAPRTARVTARGGDGREVVFEARVRIDTPAEAAYFRHGGILQYVLRGLVG
jgi:aconitate hydratase